MQILIATLSKCFANVIKGVGLHATICLPSSIGEYRACILTSDSQPIRENDSRATDILKKGATSDKIYGIGCQHTRTIHAPILPGRPVADRT